jgi:hypothetical protein
MFGNYTNAQPIIYPADFLGLLAMASFFAFFTLSNWGNTIQHKVYFAAYNKRSHIVMTLLSWLLLVICTARITTSSFNPFIYFRF